MSEDEGRWAVVAGASGGVGSAAAERLADEGWDVAVLYKSNATKAQDVAEAVHRRGRAAEVFQADLSDADRTAAVVDMVSSKGLRGVVYAAGPFIPMEYVSNVSSSMVAAQLTADALGCFNLLKPSIGHLRRAGGGAIVVVGTPALRRYAVRDVLSVMPKGALEQLVKAIAAEEGKFGIRCNMLGVGHLSDGMFDQLKEQGYYTAEYLERAKSNIALRRAGSSAEVAEAIEFLMSPRASYITGQLLNVDGGYAI